MAKFNPLKIKELINETSDAVSITFEIPNELKNDFKFIAGQYITIKTTLNNEEVRRAYSICSSPKNGTITVAVKRIEKGNFSVFATTKLKQGDVLEISAPEGNFLLNTNPIHEKNYLSFTAGSGITPIMAMVKDVLESEPNSTFTLVFGNKTKSNALFLNQLNTLKNKYTNRLILHYIFSQEQTANALYGRIDSWNVKTIISDANKDFDEVFLCGPEQMIHTVKNTLLQNNFDKSKIHFELFTSSHKNEEASENSDLDGKSEITILLDDETTTFTMNQTDNILKAALAEDLDAPYSCQGGICSSCLAKVTEGKAVMKTNNIISEEELAQGYILTCEAHPTTAKIVIDYDI